MRYRPFGRSGLALSTLGLRLPVAKLQKNRPLAQGLILAALENGMNTFHFDAADADFLRFASEVFAVVERKFLFISVAAHEVNQSPESHIYAYPAIKERLRAVIKETNLQWIDLLVFGQPGAMAIPEDTTGFLKSLQKSKMLRYIAAEGETEDLTWLVASGQFDVVMTGFDIDSDSDKRRQIDNAVFRELNVFGTDFFPQAYKNAKDVVPQAARRGWFGQKPQNPLAGAGTHAFLHQTPEWTPEQLCLGFALAQSSLSCILIDPESPEHLESLAEVPERNLPSSVPAQIEMARFNSQPLKSARA